ncbi:MAG: LysM peptidoglycan-binding domain-containing protein [Chitinophagales bacterium]|nr:LysM peptidoglycan-binding domain-containing protein [Chitinophagales bacterium]
MGKQTFIWLVALVLLSTAVKATGEVDTIVRPEEEITLFDPLDSMTNALFNACYKYNKPKPNKYGWDTAYVPTYTDDQIIKNMARIPAVIPLVYNQYVKGFINLYAVQKRNQVRRMLGLSEMYFPIFEEALDKRKMPMELKYLAIVESALNPNAVSRVGATGLWQLMYSTGKWLNMDIHSYIDERRDPYKSTEAALDYLGKLHDIYGDWLLVIAAYNCGPGNVNKAIKRSGGKTNFWEIKPFLPKETQGYVPAFIAATYVMHYYEEFNFRPEPCGFSFNAVDTVIIRESVTLSRIADQVKMSELELAYLNPSLTKRMIPASQNGYALKLPMNKVGLFEERRDSIFAGPSAEELMKQLSDASDAQPKVSYTSSYITKTHTVKSGESLGRIADKYNVSVTDLKKWNALKSSTIYSGQKLKIKVMSKVPVVTKPVVKEVEENDAEVESSTQQNVVTTETSSDVKYTPKSQHIALINYVVKAGDNLNQVCLWFDCKLADLKTWNGMQDNAIKVGQKLSLYVPADQVDYYKSIDKLSTQEKVALTSAKVKSNSPTSTQTTTETQEVRQPKVVYYMVKPGDTLWDISKRYPGVTVDDIKRSNNIGSGKGLQVGMKLKIEL